jgi:cytochrome P450 family 150 subfamily A5
MTVSDPETVNFFTDKEFQADPYDYYDALRERSPIWREPNFGVYMVTGYDEARAIYNNPSQFSSCNAVSGPFMKFPVPFEGDDVSDIIEEYRDMLPFSDQLPAFDQPKHTAHRRLLMRLLTPVRLRENEEFMWRQADALIDEFIGSGSCEFISAFAETFPQLVIADLEGVPESDHNLFRERMGKAHSQLEHKPLEFLYNQFTSYIEDRRQTPRDDIMTEMATATFSDGTLPEVNDVALLAANLFAGGQETTVRLLSFALRIIADRPDVQDTLRKDRDRIPNFIEETLRFESPLRVQFRMARVPVTVGDVTIAPGDSVMLLPGAANRDPSTFPDPATFDLDRPNAKHHIAFGHGIHHCAGAHLARAEGRIVVNSLFDRLDSLTISEAAHGPAGNRHYEYLPTYFLRGLQTLSVDFTPRGS